MSRAAGYDMGAVEMTQQQPWEYREDPRQGQEMYKTQSPGDGDPENGSKAKGPKHKTYSASYWQVARKGHAERVMQNNSGDNKGTQVRGFV